jgi:hypothetical protein
LCAQFLDRDREVGRLAAQRLFLVVVREDDVELALLALRGADEMVLEARDQPVVAEDERHPLRRPAVERLAVAGADEADDGVVALLGAAVGDRLQGAWRREARREPSRPWSRRRA